MGKKDDLMMDPKSMDGPKVETTVADLFKKNPRIFMSYHVMSAGWEAFTLAGAVVGLSAYGLGYRPKSLPATVGTFSLIGGAGGVSLGLFRMMMTAFKGEKASPPWSEDGIQQRVDGLSHNFKVRVLDKSAWTGMALASGALLLAGGPGDLGLSAGSLGIGQALALGSAIGAAGAIGCVASGEH